MMNFDSANGSGTVSECLTGSDDIILMQEGLSVSSRGRLPA